MQTADRLHSLRPSERPSLPPPLGTAAAAAILMSAEDSVYMLAAAGAGATALQLPSLRGDQSPDSSRRGREMGDAAEFRHQPARGADQKSLSLAYRDLKDVSNYVADQHGATVEYLDLSHNHIR